MSTSDNPHTIPDQYLQKLHGVCDERVLRAFATIPRGLFVPPEYINSAYEDIALPIAENQSMTQPSLVAHMTQLLCLKGQERVLEIGTGSGFGAAILSSLARVVYSIERLPSLAKTARKRIRDATISNVHISAGNGSLGLAKHAPYDAIIVTAAARHVPQELLDQLKDPGILVIPVGDTEKQILTIARKEEGHVFVRDDTPVRFVPLIGHNGWPLQNED